MAAIVPITNAPNQAIRVTLAINGKSLTLSLRLYYNVSLQCWLMDIADQFGSPIVSSVPLLTGVWPAANILVPYDHLKIGSAFVINQSGSQQDRPNDSNLGNDFLLLWDSN